MYRNRVIILSSVPESEILDLGSVGHELGFRGAASLSDVQVRVSLLCEVLGPGTQLSASSQS